MTRTENPPSRPKPFRSSAGETRRPHNASRAGKGCAGLDPTDAPGVTTIARIDARCYATVPNGGRDRLLRRAPASAVSGRRVFAAEAGGLMRHGA